jgi:hypothetical protein
LLATVALGGLPPIVLPPILPPPPGPVPDPHPGHHHRHHHHGHHHRRPRVRIATTGRRAERIHEVPITRRPEVRPRVAMSLRLPPGRAGRRARVAGEVQVSTTCAPVRRVTCIGEPYEFNPRLSARLVLSRGPDAARGSAISRRKRIVCHQRAPNRNHHCVFAFSPRQFSLPRGRSYVNLVLAAHNPHARPRQLVVVGADRPSGRIDQGQSRLGAVVMPRRGVRSTSLQVRRPERRRLATGRVARDRARVLYSVRVPRPRAGDRLLARATARLGIGRVPYNVYLRSRLILARNPHATSPGRQIARRSLLGGSVTPGNGFNSTHGRSGYRTPFRVRKAGVTAIRRVPRTGGGRRIPLYVNFVSWAKPLLVKPHAGDAARVRGGGSLRVMRYRAR